MIHMFRGSTKGVNIPFREKAIGNQGPRQPLPIRARGVEEGEEKEDKASTSVLESDLELEPVAMDTDVPASTCQPRNPKYADVMQESVAVDADVMLE